jgi:O-antigen ligase
VDKVLNHGFGGQNAQIQLGKASNPYNPFELLYYGRNEVFIAMEAIVDRPFAGYGSYGSVSEEQEVELSINQLERDYTGHEKFIPAHSVVMTAWLWGGILGFAAILYLFFLFMKMGIRVYKQCTDETILIVIMPLFIGNIWHFLFSPFGHLRITTPFILALIAAVYGRLPVKSRTSQVTSAPSPIWFPF